MWATQCPFDNCLERSSTHPELAFHLRTCEASCLGRQEDNLWASDNQNNNVPDRPVTSSLALALPGPVAAVGDVARRLLPQLAGDKLGIRARIPVGLPRLHRVRALLPLAVLVLALATGIAAGIVVMLARTLAQDVRREIDDEANNQRNVQL
ncbi:unnamed protein product [Tilletia controversa]|nr:unnamed protein product [Tilletia controversa]